MFGVTVNAIAIIVGSLVGLVFRRLISDELAKHTEVALGFCTLVIGLKMALKFDNVVILVLCMAIGGIYGHLLQIEELTAKLAQKVQRKFAGRADAKFAVGFSMASILFCTGAMAVVGSINSGLSGNHEILYAKAILDGIISASFAAIYGPGVAFSAIPVFLYQGAIALLSTQLNVLSSPQALNEISGVGGVLVVMIGVNLAKIKRIPVGDYLLAIPLVIIAVGILAK